MKTMRKLQLPDMTFCVKNRTTWIIIGLVTVSSEVFVVMIACLAKSSNQFWTCFTVGYLITLHQ